LFFVAGVDAMLDVAMVVDREGAGPDRLFKVGDINM
jgi:hypothetical protein